MNSLVFVLLMEGSLVWGQTPAPAPILQPTPIHIPPRPLPAPIRPVPPLNAPVTNGTAGSDASSGDVVENLRLFDPMQLHLTWSARRWQLALGETTLKDFGSREIEARQALLMIQDLHLNQYGTVGRPHPVMEYWLVDGHAPVAPSRENRSIKFDSSKLRVEAVQGQWCLRDAQRVWFNFDQNGDEAQRALAIFRKYHFTGVASLGQGAPIMLVFTSSSSQSSPALASPHHEGGLVSATGRSLQVPHFSRAKEPPLVANRSPGTGNEALTPTTLNTMAALGTANLKSTATPMGSPLSMFPSNGGVQQTSFWRQPTGGTVAAPTPTGPLTRVPFDWRRVQVRQTLAPGGAVSWQMVSGNTLLAHFDNEQDARMALSAIRYYRFTEEYLVGSDKPCLTYCTASRQSPFGAPLGVPVVPIAPEELTVQQVGQQFALTQGGRVVLEMGNRAEEARKLLGVIKEQKYDRLVPLSKQDGQGVAMLVKSK